MNYLMNDPSPFDKTMRELRIKHHNFGASGFCPIDMGTGTSAPADRVKEEEFYAALEYLRLNGKLIRKPTSSYDLKHIAEKAQKIYISNGALIAAAHYLGFSVRRIKGSPNATIRLPEYRTLH